MIFFLMPTNPFRDCTCCFLKLNIVTLFTITFDVSVIYLACPFDFNFFKVIHPRRVTLSSNVTGLLGTKLEKMFIIVLSKIETCLLIVLLLYKVCQFTDSIYFFILIMFPSCELRVTFKLRVSSSNPRVTSSNPRVTSLNPPATSSNPPVTIQIHKLRVQTH